MKVLLFSRSEVSDTVRYFIRSIKDRNLLITKNYNQLNITDVNFNKLEAINFENEELITDDYFSDDKAHFLWNSEDRYLYYFNFHEKNKIIKSKIPEEVLLDEFYVWSEDTYIITGLEKGESNRVLFLAYDIKLHKLNEVSDFEVLEKYSFFQEVFDCNKHNYLLYYNIKKEILIYRELRDNGDDEIVLQSSLCKKNIKVNHVDKEVHRADFLDNFLVLVHKEYVVFYYEGIEFFSINIDKKNWVFRSAYWFKHKDDFYCLVTQFDTCQPKRNVIEIYKIEK